MCSILIKHFFLKLVTPLNSTFKLVTTLHSTLDILDFFKELFVKFPLLNFQLLGLYLKRTFFVSILYNRLVQCKNLPFSNRWPQTLGSCSMSSAPPLPATKKERSKYFPELETVYSYESATQLLHSYEGVFHSTKIMPRQSPTPHTPHPPQSQCLPNRNFYQNCVINYLIECGVKDHGWGM